MLAKPGHTWGSVGCFCDLLRLLSDPPSTRIASVALARICALPIGAAEAFAGGGTSVALDALAKAETALTESAAPLEEALYRLIPALPTQRRRSALAFRRAVHNGLDEPLPGPEWEELGPAAAQLRELVEGWETLRAQRRERRRAAEERIAADLSAAAAALEAHLRAGDVADAVALASPTFAANLPPAAQLGRPEGRAARTATAYVTRAILKTSPFSSFTTHQLARFDEPVRGSTRRLSYGNRAIATSLLFAVARHRSLARALTFAPNPTLARRGTRALVGFRRVVDDFFWRGDESFDVAGHADVAAAATVATGSYAESLAKIATPCAADMFLRALDLGFLRPIAPWRRADRDPLAGLAAALDRVEDPLARPIAQELRAVCALFANLAHVTAPRRSAHLSEIRTRIRWCFAALDAPAPAWLNEGSLVYEDVRSGTSIPPLGAHVESDLHSIAKALAAHARPTVLGGVLTTAFVERFGRGGICADVHGFFADFLARPDALALMQAAIEQDFEPQHPAPASVGRSAASPSAIVYFQLAAQSSSAVAAGDYLFVVNQITTGLGGAFARLGEIHGGELHAPLREWVDALHRDATVTDFPICAEWASLQHQGLLRPEVVRWPGELPVKDDSAVCLNDVRLCHDADRDLLELRDGAGSCLAPHYLGLVPHHLTTGTLRLLFYLLDPWVNLHPAMALPFRRASLPSGEIAYEPRVTDGRIVWRRARWLVRGSSIPDVRSASPAELVLRFDRWRRALGLPSEVFVRAEGRGYLAAPTTHKPAWVSFASAHGLSSALRSVDREADSVVFEEVLPLRESHWLLDGAGKAHAAEFAAAIAWEPNCQLKFS